MSASFRDDNKPELRIHLLRHGESEWQMGVTASHDSCLTLRGQQQARLLAGRVDASAASLSGSNVFASPLKRSLETVEFLSKPFTVLSSLKEARFDIKACLPKFEGPSHHRPDAQPVGEYPTFHAVVVTLLGQLIDEGLSVKTDLFVFTHGGVIKTLLRVIHGTNAVCYRIDNCSWTTLAWYHNRWHVECLNDVSHIPQPLRS